MPAFVAVAAVAVLLISRTARADEPVRTALRPFKPEMIEQIAEQTAQIHFGGRAAVAPLDRAHEVLPKQSPVGSRLGEFRLWCVTYEAANERGVEVDSPPNRNYLAVSAVGAVVIVDSSNLDRLLETIEVRTVDDQELVALAETAIHLHSVANEDGWAMLLEPRAFLQIDFNMSADRLAARTAAARAIRAPSIRRDHDAARVTLFAWHVIGGELRRWDVGFGSGAKIEGETLGSFGGGGYE